MGALKKSNWKKGESGNPSGRPRIPVEVLELKQYNKERFATRLNDFMNFTAGELKAIAKSDSVPMFDHMLANLMIKATQGGCPARIKLLWDRLIGQVALQRPMESGQETHIEAEPPKAEQLDGGGEHYSIRLNDNGKFVSARPRLVQTIEVTAEPAKG